MSSLALMSRRYLGKEASDEELLAAYIEKIRPLPTEGREATWTFAICLALPGGRALMEQVELHEIFTDKPSLPMISGYPLSSILFDPVLGKTQRDFTREEEDSRLEPVRTCVLRLVREGLSAEPLVRQDKALGNLQNQAKERGPITGITDLVAWQRKQRLSKDPWKEIGKK